MRAATRSRKCAARRSGAAALGAREARRRSALGGARPAGASRGEERVAGSHPLLRFRNALAAMRACWSFRTQSGNLYSSALGLIAVSRVPDKNVFPDVFIIVFSLW